MSTYNPALDQNSEPPRSNVGSFGKVVFQVSEETLSLVRDVRRKTSARVEEHYVTGAKPRLEFIAPGLDETNFKVFWLYAFGVDPVAEIRALRMLCLNGAVQRLVLGGENFGRYLLTEVSESWLRSGPNGAPIAAEVSLTLKEYR